MAKVRRLTTAEKKTYIQARNKLPAHAIQAKIQAEYDDMVKDLSFADVGELTLTKAEKDATVRGRIKAAGKRRGLTIYFRRMGNTLFLEIQKEGYTRRSKKNAAIDTDTDRIGDTLPPPTIDAQQAHSTDLATSESDLDTPPIADLSLVGIAPSTDVRGFEEYSLPSTPFAAPVSTTYPEMTEKPKRGRPKKKIGETLLGTQAVSPSEPIVKDLEREVGG